MTIARVALPVALDRSFDYWTPEGLALTRGSIVRVRLARRSIIGVVVAVPSESAVTRGQLQPIDEVVSLPPLPEDVLALCEFVAGYYQQPLGMALALAVPPLGLRRRYVPAPRSWNRPCQGSKRRSTRIKTRPLKRSAPPPGRSRPFCFKA